MPAVAHDNMHILASPDAEEANNMTTATLLIYSWKFAILCIVIPSVHRFEG